MRTFLKILFTALVAIGCCGPAFAAENRTVPANRASPIFFYYAATVDTCYSNGKPNIHITHEPAHGSITSAWKGFTAGKWAGHCVGKPMHGTLIVYRPAPGYHGTDKVALRFSGGVQAGYFMREKEFIINIVVK